MRKLARAIGRSPSTVCAWRTSADRTNKAGTVPAQCHEKILKAAKKQKLDVEAEDLIFGRTVKQQKGKRNDKVKAKKRISR